MTKEWTRADAAARFRLLRERAGLTKAALAERLGRSPTHVWQIEHEVQVPTPERAAHMADVLQLSQDERAELVEMVTWVRMEDGERALARRHAEIPREDTDERGDILNGRPRICLFIGAAEATDDLYRQYVPVEGSYSRDGGILSCPDALVEGELEYLSFGPVVEGSIAVKLDEPVDAYAGGAIIVFGPPQRLPESGFGLFRLKGDPRELVCSFAAGPKDITIFEKGEAHIPRSCILEYRPLQTVV